ncbi:MAG: hypothetical protein RX318_02235 [bacterium]|nr:hypothetical protein [bacterium]
MNEQSKAEILIFEKFARVCPYAIDENTIKKEEPPKPDISCNLSDGTPMAFELVECRDESLAQSEGDSGKLIMAQREHLNALPPEQKERFNIKFKNATIIVGFVDGISLIRRKRSISKIFDYLLTLENTPEGEFDLRCHQDLKDVVRWILIRRGKYSGPMFRVKAFTYFEEPAIKAIKKKFTKLDYEIKSRTELLAYYESQPEIFENEWLPSVQECVEIDIETSVFQRVWIYSISRDEVIYVYPSLEISNQSS